MKKLLLLTLTVLSSASLSWSEIKMEGAQTTLEKGNQRFAEGKAIAHAWQKGNVAKTGALGQAPSVAVLTCSDSRTPAELIFDMGVGDLFVCRNAGGFDTPEVNATFEYGVAALGVHTILVLGHTKCGAVTATLEGKPVGIWGGRGREPGQLHNPWAIAFDSQGRLHIVDSNNHRVQRVDY